MTPIPPAPLEAAARALCRHAGNPDNSKFEGRPMWESYLGEARVALEAAAGVMGLERVERQ